MRNLAFRLLFVLSLAITAPLMTQAQNSAADISQQVEDDRGFLTSFLEEKLSDAGRQVVIEGFQGALSSRATFTRLTIADADGVWITLENGALQWSRSALLARRVEINELSAERIILPRLPGGGGSSSPPQAEAREFSLPQLPVGINIARIAVGRVELGQPIIGQPAVLSIDGSMNLSGGEGQTALTIERVDGPRGQFALDAAFSNETRVLRLDLKLDEDRNGLFTNIVKLYDRPAVRAEIAGEGPLSDFTANLRLATDGQPRVTGTVAVNSRMQQGQPGTAFRVELGGDVAALAPPQHRAFFGNQSRLLAEGWRGQDGGLSIPALTLTTEALKLSGNVTTSAQGAPGRAQLTLLLGQDAGAAQLPVLLPFADRPTTVRSGSLKLDYDAAQAGGWTLKGRVGDIARDDISLSELRLDGRGRVILTADQALSELRGWIAFGMDDLEPADPGLAQALGDTLNGGLNLAFSPGNALKLWGMNINGDDFRLTGDTTVSGLKSGIRLSGDINAEHRNVARFSKLAGRPLTGSTQAHVKGSYAILGRGFDIQAEVLGQDLGIGQPQTDRMLRGQSRIELSARRDAAGIDLRQLTVNAQNLTATAQGRLDSFSSTLRAQISMPDLSVADPDMAGAFEAEARLRGAAGVRHLTLTGQAQDLVTGIPEIDGAFRGQTALTAEAQQNQGAFELREFRLSNPQLDVQGQGSFATGAMDAKLSLAMPDLKVLGRGLSGGLKAQATLTEQDGARRLDLAGTGTELRLGPQDTGGTLSGTTDLRLSAEQRGDQITLHDFNLSNPQMLARAQGRLGQAGTDLTGSLDIRSLASFGRGWHGALQAQGSFKDDGSGARRLQVTGTGRDLALGQAQLDGALAGQTQLTLLGREQGGTFTIETARLENPRLNLDATGKLGRGTTDLGVNLRAEDLRFLGRGIRGALTAQARVSDQPGGGRQISAQGTAQGLAIGNARADAVLAGRSSFDLAASQRPDGSLTVTRLHAENPQLRVTGNGDATRGLHLDAQLHDLARLVPGFPGPATLRGTIRNAGPRYELDLTATGPGDTSARATGSVATSLASADLRLEGRSNAAAANPFLRTRSIEGPISFDLRLNGRPALESLSGRVALTGGRLAEPRLGLAIGSLNAQADIANGRLMLDIRGAVESGGTIAVTGPVTLTGARPMDLAVQLSDVVLRDPNLYQTQVNGRLTVTGSQAAGPLVSGRIDLGTTELRIPSTGLGGARAIPDITHLNERPPQRQTRAKAGLLEFPSEASREAGMSAPPATPPANPARFDLLVSAPGQVFIRGRGVDAELGGQIRLTGNARQPIPVGRFELIRGRVDLLGRRFDMTEGLIELQGSLIPVIRLVAQTERDGVTTRIIVDGEIRNPEITFESSPELPQEEVLSQLLFGRGLDRISALQAAQLASAVATLAGRGGEGIVGRLRAATGLDDLDLATDSRGNVSLRAGKYLSDSLYTDVQVDGSGKTRLNLNLDVSPTLTARGSVDTEGDSTLGLFYERDY